MKVNDAFSSQARRANDRTRRREASRGDDGTWERSRRAKKTRVGSRTPRRRLFSSLVTNLRLVARRRSLGDFRFEPTSPPRPRARTLARRRLAAPPLHPRLRYPRELKKKTTRRIVVEPNPSLRARGDVDGEKTVATPPRPKNAGTRTPDRRAAFTAALSGEALHSSERALLPARARERSLRLVPSRDASSSGVPIVAQNDARARHPRLLFLTNTRYGTPRRASLAREPRLSGSPRAASSCSASPATWRWGRRSPPP